MASTAQNIELADGASMPLIGLGTWQMGDEEAYNAVRFAIDSGYRHIDTAKMYGNEPAVGRAVRDSGVDREELFITTKLPPEDAGREAATLEESLTKLNMDYVDLWLIHWPPSGRNSVPAWEQFLMLHEKGGAKSVGVSNYSTAQLDELIKATNQAPAINQIKWGPSLFDVQRLQEHNDRDVVLEGYSPFKTTNLAHPTLTEIAEAHGVNTAQVVLRWHVEHGIVAIPKSVTEERIAANLAIFDFELTADEVQRIDNLAS